VVLRGYPLFIYSNLILTITVKIMNITKLIISGVIMSVVSVSSIAQNSIAVEWAPYIKLLNVSDEELIEAAEKVNSDFLSLQKGFLKRELVKKSTTEYADIIHWNTKADAVSASLKVENCAVCSEYFKLMNMEASSSAGAGFAHYNILKTW
jgi:hypothetical protein